MLHVFPTPAAAGPSPYSKMKMTSLTSSVASCKSTERFTQQKSFVSHRGARVSCRCMPFQQRSSLRERLLAAVLGSSMRRGRPLALVALSCACAFVSTGRVALRSVAQEVVISHVSGPVS